MSNLYGRQVVIPLTNKSGGGVIAGDVVIVDTSNNDAFTTTTSAGFTGGVGIAQETIASNFVGRVLVGGYAALVNTTASVTRGNFGTTSTTVKKAVDAGSSRAAGTFCQFLTGGTTPDAIVYPTDLASSAGVTVQDEGSPLATTGTTLNFVGAGVVASGAGSTKTVTIPGGGASRVQLGYTTLGGSFKTARGKYYKKITVATAGYLMSVTAGVKGNGSSFVGLTVGVMSDSAGTPLNMIATGYPLVDDAAVALDPLYMNTTARFVTVPIGIWLPAGDYWLVIAMMAGADSRIQLAYDATTGGTDRSYTTGPSPVMGDHSLHASSVDTTMNLSIYGELLTL